MGKGSRNRNIRKDEEVQKQLLSILEASDFTRKEKIKIFFIKVFLKVRMKRVCRKLYGFKYRSQKRMFRRVIRNTYAEGIVLKNLADFHLMGITKCNIRNKNWKMFLKSNGKVR